MDYWAITTDSKCPQCLLVFILFFFSIPDFNDIESSYFHLFFHKPLVLRSSELTNRFVFTISSYLNSNEMFLTEKSSDVAFFNQNRNCSRHANFHARWMKVRQNETEHKEESFTLSVCCSSLLEISSSIDCENRNTRKKYAVYNVIDTFFIWLCKNR